MNRPHLQRAVSRVDLDAYAHSIGFTSKKQFEDLTRLHQQLDSGGDISYAEAEHLRSTHYPAIPADFFHNGIVAYIKAGADGHARADRMTDAVRSPVDLQTGVPAPSPEREHARSLSRNFATQEFAADVTAKLNERDAHRDRHAGIEEAKRVEQAQRAAMQSPDAIRRADAERAWAQHEGPQPTLYAHDRREMAAQAADRNAERLIKQSVRDADPHRLPDRGDDRRDDIALSMDCLTVAEVAHDELNLAANPLLEAVDNALTETHARHDET